MTKALVRLDDIVHGQNFRLAQEFASRGFDVSSDLDRGTYEVIERSPPNDFYPVVANITPVKTAMCYGSGDRLHTVDSTSPAIMWGVDHPELGNSSMVNSSYERAYHLIVDVLSKTGIGASLLP
ncbi:hypothetical protein J4216_00165 [Candidatus Woesearchaeota archaeon]|nr:hypothetical protein [Candidatus Woesearchaeota archaeon]